MNAALTFLIVSIVKIVVTVFVLLTGVAYTVWLERKVVGRMQNRFRHGFRRVYGRRQTRLPIQIALSVIDVGSSDSCGLDQRD